jgi:hypothetical protein
MNLGSSDTQHAGDSNFQQADLAYAVAPLGRRDSLRGLLGLRG